MVIKNGASSKTDTPKSARTAALARRGVRTSRDFATMMSGLMSDVIEGKVSPQISNAACNAGGKLLKVVEMQYRYGGAKNRHKTLALSSK